jgi:serine/threonine protein phosphatase PrpC
MFSLISKITKSLPSSSISDWNDEESQKSSPSLPTQIIQGTFSANSQHKKPTAKKATVSTQSSPHMVLALLPASDQTATKNDEVKSSILQAPNCSTWIPRQLPVEKSMEKMHKNAVKAIREHVVDEENSQQAAYASLEEAIPSIEVLQKVKERPLTFSHSAHAEQSKRPTMEDAHFYLEFERGVIAGVMDGHGGSAVANYASEEFKKRFPACLEKFQGNVHQAFEYLIDEIHQEVAKNNSWKTQGTTAVISFIDKHTHTIYTATLADSEANIYRKINARMKSIPLSVVRNWASKKEALRAAIANNDPAILDNWPTYKGHNTKWLRVNNINISRSIGDLYSATLKGQVVLVHKPKITVNQLQPGDTLVLACDGLKDFVSEKEITDLIAGQPANLAEALAMASLKNQQYSAHGDNVTVIAIHVS